MTNILKKTISSLFLMAVLVMVFSACQKVEEDQIMENQIVQESTESFKGHYFTPPVGYEDEQKLASYLENASNDLIEKLIENYKVAEFLYQENLIWSVKDAMKEGDHYSDIDLTLYLNSNQLNAFNSFVPEESELVIERGCVSSFSPCYTKCCNTHPLYGQSCTRYSFC